MTIHPNKLLVATGQTAGHDNREGKVRIEAYYVVILFVDPIFDITETKLPLKINTNVFR